MNGLEAGQTFIVSCAVLFHNLYELSGVAGTIPAGGAGGRAAGGFTCRPVILLTRFLLVGAGLQLLLLALQSRNSWGEMCTCLLLPSVAGTEEGAGPRRRRHAAGCPHGTTDAPLCHAPAARACPRRTTYSSAPLPGGENKREK